MDLTPEDRSLLAALQGGLPLVERPYAALGEAIGLSENEVIARLERYLQEGLIKRLGVVVRHHELGYRANAMTVWDVPDEHVDEVARRLAASGKVTLCYRRPRRPGWPYNLFCMIHGKSRPEVLETLEELQDRHGLREIPCEVLFSTRRFKQEGARYLETRS